MPKRDDIKSILIIGAGPIVIGQACEFDYSGTQACKALKEEGYRIILLNSNPATIMTDPGLADATYIEPITAETVKIILGKENPDAILPTMGGQTALNTALTLAKDGTLEDFRVELIGANLDAIEKAEDRLLFREAMDRIGLESPLSHLVETEEEGARAVKDIGLPAILRPSFTLAGTGGGIAYNIDEFNEILRNALRLSPVGTVLIEESVLGWKEFEMEVVRDKNDNCIIVCSIENVDPMGIHTGDSITVAPALTLTDKEYQRMRTASIEVLREIGVDTGGSNVQFAVNPNTGRLVVIEMNPRVSRSSALASKATGFPIAKIAAKLAVGYTLDELENDITKETPASFEPTIDYVVTKIPRFTFEKFAGAEATLTTSMKSVGEAMAIGRTFLESLQKALNSMETGLTGFDEISLSDRVELNPDKSAILAKLSEPVPERLLRVAQALRLGLTVNEIYEACSIDRWFLRQIQVAVEIEKAVIDNGIPENKEEFFQLKRNGFSDARLAKLSNKSESEISEIRSNLGVAPVFKRIDTCAAEFSANTPYMYSCYEGDGLNLAECEADPTDKNKVIILGGGPNRIGQGIEFDYCCVHAAYALSEVGFETIMVNCNPETVSTDYDTSDRLYFEPLTAERVISLIKTEEKKGKVLGVIVQLGGQTPLKLSKALKEAGISILGTSPRAIDLAEDREQFKKLLDELNLKQPQNGTVNSFEEAKIIAEEIGYPVVIRPSYVLGGRAMEIVYEEAALNKYMEKAVLATGDNPILIDKFLSKAIEIDVDLISDGKEVYIAGILEHLEPAGVHRGDSTAVIPPYSVNEEMMKEVEEKSKKLALGLNVKGLLNIQFAIKDEELFILEANPRASRTMPFVAKVTGNQIIKAGTLLMLGYSIDEVRNKTKYLSSSSNKVAIKKAIFPWSRFPAEDTMLGPEMKATGEVLGVGKEFGTALNKAYAAAGVEINNKEKGIFVTLSDSEKPNFIKIVNKYLELGFKLYSTEGTGKFLKTNGIDSVIVGKADDLGQTSLTIIEDKLVSLVINTPTYANELSDGWKIRRLSHETGVAVVSSVREADAFIEAFLNQNLVLDDLEVIQDVS